MQKLDFRAYDKQNEILIEHAQNGYTIFYPMTKTSTTIPFETMLNDDNYIVDQYVGVDDRYDQPIFENDVVENTNTHKKFIVKYVDCSFLLEDFDTRAELPTEYLSSFANALIVVGNIYGKS